MTVEGCFIRTLDDLNVVKTDRGQGEARRIEESPRLMSLWIGKAVWTRDDQRGHTEGVTFRNIRAKADPLLIELKGFDETHAVEGVAFEDVVVNGRPLTAGDVSTNTFVRDVTIRP